MMFICLLKLSFKLIRGIRLPNDEFHNGAKNNVLEQMILNDGKKNEIARTLLMYGLFEYPLWSKSDLVTGLSLISLGIGCHH